MRYDTLIISLESSAMKKETLTLSVEASTKQRLESLASELGYVRGTKPNMSGLVEAIAAREIALGSASECQPIPIEVEELLLEALEKADFRNQVVLGTWLRDRLDISSLPRIEKILKEMEPFQSVMSFIDKQQPFKLFYQDAAANDYSFSVLYAQLSMFDNRSYLECWCEETEKNQDISGLRHNWCFRPDRIQNAGIVPLSGNWRTQGLDRIQAEFLLFDGLAHGYESKPGDQSEWIKAEPPTRKVIRPITNSFWFLRKILPYGAKCQVVGNSELLTLAKQEAENLYRNYC
jgi:predicted DNA-binding transcriptional regulator YafY